MIYLRQSTASQEVPLGYFVDSTDGNTEETALTIANTDIKIWKTGATTLANKNSGGATHISNGVYYAVLDATDTDTIGPLVVFVHVSGALTVRLDCCVLDEAVYDVMFGTTAPSTLTQTQVTGGAYALNSASFAFAADVINANALATDAVNEIRNAITGGAYDLDTDANGRIRIVDGTAAGEVDTTSGKVNALLAASDVTGNVSAVLADGVSHGGTLGSSTATLALARLSIVSQTTDTAALTVTGNGSGVGAAISGGATGHGATIAAGATSGDGLRLTSATLGTGLYLSGAGANKYGLQAVSGSAVGIYALGSIGGILAAASSSGYGIRGAAAGAAGNALELNGAGSGDGVSAMGGATGHGLHLIGGGTSGSSIKATTTSGHCVDLAATGTSMHGLLITGGNGGTSDGLKAVAGTGGVPIRGDITGNITGTLSTVTTLTNLPSITSDWLTAAGLATDAVQEIRNAVTGYAGAINCDSGGNVGVQDGTGANQIGLTSGAVDVVTTLTNDPSGVTTLLSRLTATRAGYLDNLSAGAVPTLSQILTTAMTESYAANGAAPSLAQALFAIHQDRMAFSIAGTTKTVKKLDGSTTAFLETLNDATSPTALTRA